MAAIIAQHLHKRFQVQDKGSGLWSSISDLFHRQYRHIDAVKSLSFEISIGELVGFIGPNGAGKTTTLKCLSGLLYPDSGKIKVLGYTPFQRNHSFLKNISLIMGQKNQLWWDLPAMESFLLNKAIYEIKDDSFKTTLSLLTDMLEVNNILTIPVRKLSLGQRMKCELIAALLHSPKVLFLDEPTIGLDVVMQKKMRNFIKEYNQQFEATIILTSHYMQDVIELCKRVLIIDKGQLIYDGKLSHIKKKYGEHKILKLTFSSSIRRKDLEQVSVVKQFNFPQATIWVDKQFAPKLAAQLLTDFPIADITIEEPPIEDIIRQLFTDIR